MRDTAPVAVIIPTYNRGIAVFSVIDRIAECKPTPAEILVHVDSANGILEAELSGRFPNVKILTSPTRIGGTGGRHRCLLACSTPYAVSFDDDSYPVDRDFFGIVERLFGTHPKAAVFGAQIWHRHEAEKLRREYVVRTPNYIGCGHAIRLTAYRSIRGYLPRPVGYEMEESDVSLQLFAGGWQIYEAGNLRVFHDTALKHHESLEITSGSITNIGLRVYLHYPVIAWGWGLLQLGNKVVHCTRIGRLRGIWSGLARIPSDCYRNRQHRKPLLSKDLRAYLKFCRTGHV
jgi:GT2 family glycosyltransferase